MLVKSEPISKFPMMLSKSFTVHLLVVNGFEVGLKYFTSLYVGVCKADKIGLNGGQP